MDDNLGINQEYFILSKFLEKRTEILEQMSVLEFELDRIRCNLKSIENQIGGKSHYWCVSECGLIEIGLGQF